MAKRSNFKKRKHDAYMTTDKRAVKALLPYLQRGQTFAEPCAGEMDLVNQLCEAGLECEYANDISWDPGADALTLTKFSKADMIITNPPWTRQILHNMILHFCHQAPTWLLIDADWAFTLQAKPFLSQCSDIVAIGRLKWVAGTEHQAKDNCAWYKFDMRHRGPTVFHGKV